MTLPPPSGIQPIRWVEASQEMVGDRRDGLSLRTHPPPEKLSPPRGWVFYCELVEGRKVGRLGASERRKEKKPEKEHVKAFKGIH